MTRASGTRKAEAEFELALYVSGMTERSARAIQNIKQICETHLKGRYDLRVYDIVREPDLARNSEIVAAPTLLKKLPDPLRRVIGDFSDEHRVLVGLGLRPREEQE